MFTGLSTRNTPPTEEHILICTPASVSTYLKRVIWTKLKGCHTVKTVKGFLFVILVFVQTIIWAGVRCLLWISLIICLLFFPSLPLCVNAAPAKAALGTCHGNIMSGINVVLRYMTRDLILHHSLGRLDRRHTCVRMDSAVTSNELHSCYSHFLFSKTRPDDKKKNVRRTVIHIHHVLMISVKVRPMETGYWTEFLHMFIENAGGGRRQVGECLQGWHLQSFMVTFMWDLQGRPDSR